MAYSASFDFPLKKNLISRDGQSAFDADQLKGRIHRKPEVLRQTLLSTARPSPHDA
jgi:hypothetical protein